MERKATGSSKRGGILNFTTLVSRIGDPDLMAKLKNRQLPLTPFTASTYGIAQTIIEDSKIAGGGTAPPGMFKLIDDTKRLAFNFVKDFL